MDFPPQPIAPPFPRITVCARGLGGSAGGRREREREREEEGGRGGREGGSGLSGGRGRKRDSEGARDRGREFPTCPIRSSDPVVSCSAVAGRRVSEDSDDKGGRRQVPVKESIGGGEVWSPVRFRRLMPREGRRHGGRHRAAATPFGATPFGAPGFKRSKLYLFQHAAGASP